jgi:hypothetical protein
MKTVLLSGMPRLQITREVATRLVVTAPGPQGSPGGYWQTFVFSSASTIWRVCHRRGTRRFQFTARDEAGELQLVGPQVVSDDEFFLEFQEPIAGTLDVFFEAVR